MKTKFEDSYYGIVWGGITLVIIYLLDKFIISFIPYGLDEIIEFILMFVGLFALMFFVYGWIRLFDEISNKFKEWRDKRK